jgi:hypothetical protein
VRFGNEEGEVVGLGICSIDRIEFPRSDRIRRLVSYVCVGQMPYKASGQDLWSSQ